MRRKHPNLTWDQKPQRVDRVPDPADVGDDGHPLPLGHVLDPDIKILPRRGGAATIMLPGIPTAIRGASAKAATLRLRTVNGNSFELR
jgi:hypothetical protein